MSEVTARTPREAKRWVDAQKDEIARALAAGDVDLAGQRTLELLRTQRAEGRDDLAAKSLCDLAKRAQRLGVLEYAKSWLTEARALAPNDPIVWAQIVHLARVERSAEAHLSWSERMLAQLPDDPLALVTRATALHAAGRLDESLAMYDRAIAARPEDTHARTGRAAVLRNAGRLAEAERELEEAAALFPSDPVVWTGLLGVVRDAGALRRAVEVCGRALRAVPWCGRIHARLGDLLLSLGRPDEALAEHEHALRIEPGEGSAHRARARALITLGQASSALVGAQRLLDEQPGNAYARIMRAEANMDLGRLGEALRDFQRVVADGRMDAAARASFALTTMRLGRLEEAQRILASAAVERYDRPATAGRWSIRLLRSALSLKREGPVDSVGLHAVRTSPFVEPSARAANVLAVGALLRGAADEAAAVLHAAPQTESVVISGTHAVLVSLAAGDAAGVARSLRALPVRTWCQRALAERTLDVRGLTKRGTVLDAVLELLVS